MTLPWSVQAVFAGVFAVLAFWHAVWPGNPYSVLFALGFALVAVLWAVSAARERKRKRARVTGGDA